MNTYEKHDTEWRRYNIKQNASLVYQTYMDIKVIEIL